MKTPGNKAWTNHPKKYVPSQYHYVYGHDSDMGIYWVAKLPKFKLCKYFNTEREAAKAVDVCLIKNGKKPLNLLKPL